jgi:hypothetical protein
VADRAAADGGAPFASLLGPGHGELEPAAGAGPNPDAAKQMSGRPSPQVRTVLAYAAGLLRWAEDRKHAGKLAAVAEGHTEHADRRVPGQYGQLLEAAAALTLRPNQAAPRVVQVHHARQRSCRTVMGRTARAVPS